MSKETKKQIVRDLYLLITMLMAFSSAVWLWYYNVGVGWDKGYFGTRTLATVGVLYCIVYFSFSKMYKAHKIGAYHLTELSFSQMLSFGIADVALYGSAFFWFHNFERIQVHLFVLAFMVQGFVVIVLTFCMNRLHARFDEPRKVAIIYGEEGYQLLYQKMKDFSYRYKILGCIEQNTDKEKLYRILAECKDVYLYEVNEELRQELLLYCEKKRKDIHFSLSIADISLRGCDVSHFFDTPFLRNRKADVQWYYPIIKRFFDIILSLIALVIASPFMLITAIAIKIEDGGHIFYTQKRLTAKNKTFSIIKFRSMKENSEDVARLASEGDDRITKVGHVIRRFRIDEIPQLFNILKGDMSIVGPRPERPEIASEYEKELPEFAMRLKVKAGLTGYAQVYGKYNTTPLDKLKLDLIYISQRSVMMDLQIMFYTVKILFIPESTEGVAEGQTTAQREIS
ncbi:MAG: exopolysaccharide biosynthesis polyprenyl glycosylphosphotransferase [Lachnospiraceae bacterium]|nr:exopolysaccharide biosynthesis polyprenyl glycosylphosphotransferase [Lachnospiraceae bacterium]